MNPAPTEIILSQGRLADRTPGAIKGAAALAQRFGLGIDTVGQPTGAQNDRWDAALLAAKATLDDPRAGSLRVSGEHPDAFRPHAAIASHRPYLLFHAGGQSCLGDTDGRAAGGLYLSFGLDALAEELEEPFGTMPNDLPLAAYAIMIERHMRAALGETELPPAPEPRDYVLT